MKQSESKKTDVEDRDEPVPLMSSDTDLSETEKVIPFWAEEFEVSKKIVKAAELVIRKRKAIEKKKIDIDIEQEQVTIKYHDGRPGCCNNTCSVSFFNGNLTFPGTICTSSW